MGLWVTIAAGITNMVLDALFVAVFRWGVAGAAVASAIGQAVGGGIPLVTLCAETAVRSTSQILVRF